MAFTDSADNAPEGGGGPPPGPELGPGGPTSPPPQGGGPVLAALARRSLSPPVSTPGPGNMAAGLMMLKQAVDMIHAALPNLEAGSKPHTDAVNALGRLTKHLPQGQPTVGVQQTQLQDMLRNTARNAMLQKIMSQRQAGGGGGGAPGAGGGGGGNANVDQGGPGQQPLPSTPLPGA